MEKVKNKFVVLAYVLLMVSMLFYIDVNVVKVEKKLRKDAESEMECLNIQIECLKIQNLDLKREKSKLLKVNDSLLNLNPYIVGEATWYGEKFHGRLMANGKIYDKNKYTAASPLIGETTRPKYPFGTKLRVKNVINGKSVVVTITDTGGFGKICRELSLSERAFAEIAGLDSGKICRELDLSEGAFDKIADLDTGKIIVKIEKV